MIYTFATADDVPFAVAKTGCCLHAVAIDEAVTLVTLIRHSGANVVSKRLM